MKIDCPTCGKLDDVEHLPGVLINRKLSLASEIITLGEQIKRINPKVGAEAVVKLKLEARLQVAREELAELEGHVVPDPHRTTHVIPDYTPQLKTVRPPMADPTPVPETPAPLEPSYIEFEDFQKVVLQIGVIRKAETVEKSKKLLKLTVDFGEATPRTVMSGIASILSASNGLVGLEGVQAVFVTNLKPRKIMGVESQAMILAAVEGDSLAILGPDLNRSPGTRVG